MKKNLWTIIFMTVLLVLGIGLHPLMAETITLRWSYIWSDQDYKGPLAKWFASEIEKRTQGRVKIQIYWGRTLCQPAEMAEFVKNGMADIGWVNPSYHRKFGQLSLIPSNVDLFFKRDPQEMTKKWLEFNEQFPELREDYAKTNMIPIYQKYLDTFIIYSKKPIRTLDDFKGVKIRAMGKVHQIALKKLGAIPVFIPIEETYSAVQKNIINAVSTVLEIGHGDQRFYEVAPYVILVDLAGDPIWAQHCLNLNSFKKLTPEDQKTILQVGKETSLKVCNDLVAHRENLLKKIKKDPAFKGEYIRLSPEDEKRWGSIPELQEHYDAWVNDMENKGYPARKGLALWKKMIQE